MHLSLTPPTRPLGYDTFDFTVGAPSEQDMVYTGGIGDPTSLALVGLALMGLQLARKRV